jgi:hypothetical protein
MIKLRTSKLVINGLHDRWMSRALMKQRSIRPRRAKHFATVQVHQCSALHCNVLHAQKRRQSTGGTAQSGGDGIVKVSASLDSIPGGNVILDEKCG